MGAYDMAEMARKLSKGKDYSMNGIGKIMKDQDGYRFIPSKKMENLIAAAGKYSKILPYNQETKALWAIDSIGDGGLHLNDEEKNAFYLHSKNGFLSIVEKPSVSDELDEHYEMDDTILYHFVKKNAKQYRLHCPSEK